MGSLLLGGWFRWLGGCSGTGPEGVLEVGLYGLKRVGLELGVMHDQLETVQLTPQETHKQGQSIHKGQAPI